MRKLWYSTSSGRIELQITRQDVKSVCHSGSNDAAVLEVSKKPYIKKQIDKIDAKTLADELSEYGAWNEVELSDNAQNIQRLLWCACWDIFENMKG